MNDRIQKELVLKIINDRIDHYKSNDRYFFDEQIKELEALKDVIKEL